MHHKARFLGVAAVVLMLGQAAYADFTADITMSGSPPDPSDVGPGTAIVLTLIDTQTFNVGGPPAPFPWPDGSYINWIQMNFEDSSTGVHAALEAGTWAWGAAINAGLPTGNDLMDDLMVDRAAVGSGIKPASPITIGTLTFDAPAALGTYTISLTGGDWNVSSDTFILSGMTYLELPEQGGTGMTAETYTFTVTPEPATMLLLGAGAVVAIIRRKR